VIGALLCAQATAFAQQPLHLDSFCTVTVGNQTVAVQPDGTFNVPNIALFRNALTGVAPQLYRVRATCLRDGEMFTGQSDFFELVTGQTTFVADIFPTALDPIPVQVTATSDATFVPFGETVQMTVTGTYADGTSSDLTARSDGTTYLSTNAALLTVDQNGVVTGQNSASAGATAMIAVLNEGNIATISFTAVGPSDDFDSDGLPNDYEDLVGLNKFADDAAGDLDGDGLTNADEFTLGTLPNNADTDGDGIDDAADSNPLHPEENPPIVTLVSPVDGALRVVGETVVFKADITEDGLLVFVELSTDTGVSVNPAEPPFEVSVVIPSGVPEITFSVMARDAADNETIVTALVEVAEEDPLTTVTGFVVDPLGTPIAGVEVDALGHISTTLVDGSFAIPTVPTILGPVQVMANVDLNGLILVGSSSSVIANRRGDTAVGVIQLGNKGKVVVNNDEYTLSNTGFGQSPDAAVFINNVAEFFADGPGTFHAYSTNFGFTQSELSTALSSGGHTYSTGVNIPLDEQTLSEFDALFVGGTDLDSAQISALISYVNGGGNVYLAAGASSSSTEAAAWNPFLSEFGMSLASSLNFLSGNIDVSTATHPIFDGVSTLFQSNGRSISGEGVVFSVGGQGLYAVYDPQFGFVQGFVHFEDGSAVENAEVRTSLGGIAYTDGSGFFKLATEAPANIDTVEVSASSEVGGVVLFGQRGPDPLDDDGVTGVGVTTIAPLISSCSTSVAAVSEGASLTLSVDAPLGTTFAWSQLSPASPVGSFDSPGQSSTSWVAPILAEDTTVEVRVQVITATGVVDDCVVSIAVDDACPGAYCIDFRTPPPAQLASGEEFDIEFELIGDFAHAQGNLGACDSNFPLNFCTNLEHQAFDDIPGTSYAPPGSSINGSYFSGGPGVYGQRIRAFDCDGPRDYSFIVSATFEDHQGMEEGPFSSPVGETTVAAPTQPELRLSHHTREFSTFEGVDPPTQIFVVHTTCNDDFGWIATADVPWITLDPASDAASSGSSVVTIAIDATGLEVGEHLATITVTSAQASNGPLTLAVPLTVVESTGYEIVWTIEPPAQLASGEEFDIEFELIGDFADAQGDLGACDSNYPLNFCRDLDYQAFDAIHGTSYAPPGSSINGSYFYGSPGIYGQRIRAFDCDGPNDYVFVATADFEDDQGSEFGPFSSPVVETTVAAPTVPEIYVSPQSRSFNAFIETDPPPRNFSICTTCRDDLDWSALADVPWINLSSQSDTTSNGCSTVSMSINVAGLEAGEHAGIITVDSPQATNDPVMLEVTLAIVEPATFDFVWTIAPPAQLTSGEEFDIEFELLGDFVEAEGDLGACQLNSSVGSCSYLDNEGFDEIHGSSYAPPGSFLNGSYFRGGPGIYGQRIRAFDCDGPNDYFFVVSAEFEDQQGMEFGPFTSSVAETTVAEPAAPELTISPQSREFNAFLGINPLPQSFHICTTCRDDVDWSAAADVPWIGLDATSGVTNNGCYSFTISIDVTALDAGEYTGTITVESPQAMNGSVELAVSLTVL
jgi:hypothetical protein